MEQRAIGSLAVSVVGVGLQQLRRPPGPRATRDGRARRARRGRQPLRHRRHLRRHPVRGVLRPALGARRDEAVIATKFGMPIDDTHYGARPEYVQAGLRGVAARASGTDRIDLYQLHFPDDTVPIADTLGALRRPGGGGQGPRDRLLEPHRRPAARGQGRRRGRARPSSRSRTSTRCSRATPSATACSRRARASAMGFLPYYPLANGLLTGKVQPGEPIPEGTRLVAACRPSAASTG